MRFTGLHIAVFVISHIGIRINYQLILFMYMLHWLLLLLLLTYKEYNMNKQHIA